MKTCEEYVLAELEEAQARLVEAQARIEELEAENAALRNRNRYCEEVVEAMRPKAEAYGVSYEFDWSKKRVR